MRKTLLFFASAFFFSNVVAQEILSLNDCIRLGLKQNLTLESSRNELEKSKHSVSENRANLLPKLNAFANFNDNFNPPVSVTDGSSYGKPYNVTNTLQFNAVGGLQFSMPLYNQTLYTSMNVVKLVNKISTINYEKAKRDLVLQITQMYYVGQTTMEQLELIRSNIARMEALKSITQALYDNDMTLEVDVQRVDINLRTLKVQCDNVEAMFEQQLNTLKYVIDYPLEKNISLVAADVNNIEEIELTGLSPALYELEMLKKQSELAIQRKKMIGNGYLPSLHLTGNWNYTAFTDKFKNWFHSGPSNHWYNSNGIGLSLRIPIFDGFDKKYKTKKAKLDIANARLMEENAYKSMEMQYINATKDLMNNKRNLKKNKENCELAEKVYAVTSDRYKEGIVMMTEVLQDEMQMVAAQNNYLSAFLNYRLSSLTLLKLTNNVEKLIPASEEKK